MRSQRKSVVSLLIFSTLTLGAATLTWAGTSSRTGTVKPTSAFPFTSFTVQTNNTKDNVTGPPGWNSKKTGPRTWEFTGGPAVPPGGNFTVTATRPGPTLPTVSIVGGDYKDNNGNHVWVTSCPDPLGNIVIKAGGTPVDYLGYTIPAGQYGYFFEWWNPAGFTDQTKAANLFLGLNSGAYNFATIANSFTVAQLAQLGNVQVFGADASLRSYMQAVDATGIAGMQVSWSYNKTTGVASMIFNSGDPNQGLGAGESSEIMAFTTANAPIISDSMNASAVYLSNYGCPGGSTYIPEVPEPSTLAMLGSGVLSLAAVLRRRPSKPMA